MVPVFSLSRFLRKCIIISWSCPAEYLEFARVVLQLNSLSIGRYDADEDHVALAVVFIDGQV